MTLPTPRKVVRYSVAATAAYTITAPLVGLLLSIAQTLVIIAILAFIDAIACIVTWINEPDRWLLIYLGICVTFFVAAVLPLAIGAWCFCRYVKRDPDEPMKGVTDRG
jgi:hypothetical protein